MQILDLGILAAIAYGVLAILGGIMGYVKAQSTVSLISGGLSGLLLILSGVLQLQGQEWARIGAIAITALLIVTFTVRWIKTRKVMPAALMVGLGLVALIVMVLQILQGALILGA